MCPTDTFAALVGSHQAEVERVRRPVHPGAGQSTAPPALLHRVPATVNGRGGSSLRVFAYPDARRADTFNNPGRRNCAYAKTWRAG